MQAGFIVTGGSLLPPLLALYGIPEALVWRVSSVIAAIPIVLFVATVPRRRRAATGGSRPFFIQVLLFLQLMLALYLLANAAAIGLQPGAAHFAAAMAGMLVTSGIAYLLALGLALRQPLPPHR